MLQTRHLKQKSCSHSFALTEQTEESEPAESNIIRRVEHNSQFEYLIICKIIEGFYSVSLDRLYS